MPRMKLTAGPACGDARVTAPPGATTPAVSSDPVGAEAQDHGQDHGQDHPHDHGHDDTHHHDGDHHGDQPTSHGDDQPSDRQPEFAPEGDQHLPVSGYGTGESAAPHEHHAEAAGHAQVTEAGAEQETDADSDDDEPASLEHGEAPRLSDEPRDDSAHEDAALQPDDNAGAERDTADASARDDDGSDNGNGEATDEDDIVESVGGADAMEEVPDRTPRYRRQYKIQEVIKRRQIMLVQVVKEERGTKGAALTTYLSLAGRYSVLMPNTARGGGISRKITNVQDRKRLKEIAEELEVPEGMGVILRTAGAARTKTEVKRDFEYLLRAWETVRDLTLKSTAPTLVYEEGSLVKRSIRDLYNKDIDEVIVAGETAYTEARDFMRMLMPSHAKNVKLFKESQPLLTRYGIESQLDAMFSPVVQLRSGGYIVLNQAEALVAIDVNSGRATREHHIEDTALKTNLEAAEEVARQLRLRDLAGLIVIDFIDMDEKRNNRSVERRLKDCLKNDRARIQVGRISHFGLLEMSRQRIRTSVLESSTDKCPHCGGTGHVRSVSSVALQCLRMIEETLQRGATHNIILRTRSEIALYVLNQKRSHLHELEHRFQISVTVTADPTISGQLPFLIEKGEQVHSPEQARALLAQAASIPIAEPEPEEADAAIEDDAEDEEDADIFDTEAAEPGEHAQNGDASEAAENGDGTERGEAGVRRRRRRRRRGRRGDVREGGFAHEGGHEGAPGSVEAGAPERGHDQEHGGEADPEHPEANGEAYSPHEPTTDMHAGEQAEDDGEPGEQDAEGAGTHRPAGPGNGNGDGGRRRRRGRRGGRRNRREEGEASVRSPEYGVEPIDEEVIHAVADFGGPPIEAVPHASHQELRHEELRHEDLRHGTPERTPAEARHHEPASQPVPAVSEPASAKLEPPRRRSTIREPAPFAMTGGAPALPTAAEPIAPPPVAPPPEDAAPEAARDTSSPRRAGWWAKRIFGDKE